MNHPAATELPTAGGDLASVIMLVVDSFQGEKYAA
jgi:hypothetical protein